MMLRDGKHIKEPPPQIGKYWIPQMWNGDKTYEEKFMQEVLLDKNTEPTWKKLLIKLLQS
jgi:hypothetical protein